MTEVSFEGIIIGYFTYFLIFPPLFPEKQKVKAAKMAKQFVLDKFYPKYKEMGMPQRVKIDQLVKVKYGGMIAKLTQKYMKKVKAKELVKVKKAREAKKDA